MDIAIKFFMELTPEKIRLFPIVLLMIIGCFGLLNSKSILRSLLSLDVIDTATITIFVFIAGILWFSDANRFRTAIQRLFRSISASHYFDCDCYWFCHPSFALFGSTPPRQEIANAPLQRS